MNKFLLATLASLLLLAGCSSKVDSENQIVVGLECDYAPFNWTQIESSDSAVAISGSIGYCDGYDITMASAIAEGLGKELIVKKIAWEGLEAALSSGEIDMIVAGMTDTAERRERVSFSDPYYASDMVLIVRNDSTFLSATSLQDFNNAKVVAQRGTFHNDLVPQIPGVIHMTPLTSFPLLANAVISGESDAMVSERPVAISIVNMNPQLAIVDFATGQGFVTDVEETTVSVAIRQVDSDLRNQINTILAGISDETRNLWMADALSRQPEGIE